MDKQGLESEIAIIGLGGRFPGARDTSELWHNLCAGRVTVGPAPVGGEGVDPALVGHPRYVPARGRLDDIESFDLEFWGLTFREAQILDPQQRVFMECAFHALEAAGYAAPDRHRRVAVFGTSYLSSYLLHNLLPNQELLQSVGMVAIHQANAPDQLAARVAYKLGLTGPAIGVQTACSSSLVAVHLACQSLLAGECDLALAGGVSIVVPQDQGYVPIEGGILSPDGVCRPFDVQARGTVFSNGAGVVALKRLDEAMEDGDFIYAVIAGSAVNNDGGERVGYSAPGYQGQLAVVRDALTFAAVRPEDLGYIEAHGTGTELGDAMEVAALAEVMPRSSASTEPCVLGSIKGNIGHLDNAAGVAGLIKAVLAIHHGKIPGTANLLMPSPKLALGSSLTVARELRDWPRREGRRYAGVSAFGMGGTNAHVILEQAPASRRVAIAAPGHAWVLPLSAKSTAALDAQRLALAAALRSGSIALVDAAHTLQVARPAFAHRWFAVCRNNDEAIVALEGRLSSSSPGGGDRAVVAAGEAFVRGERVDWLAAPAARIGRRVPLPAYPFQRQHCWVDRSIAAPSATRDAPASGSAACYHRPWTAATLDTLPRFKGRESWLVFVDGGSDRGLAADLVRRLRDAGQVVTVAEPGAAFARRSPTSFALRPDRDADYDDLLRELRALAIPPSRIAHLSGAAATTPQAAQRRFLDLCRLARATNRFGLTRPIGVTIVTCGAFSVLGDEAVLPEAALASGLVHTWPREMPQVRCSLLDVTPDVLAQPEPEVAPALAALCASPAGGQVLAWRGRRFWTRSFEALPAARAAVPVVVPDELREGLCIVTGGLGGVGFALAHELARQARVKLALIQRTPLGAAPAAVEARRRERLDALGGLAPAVRCYAADVANPAAVERVLTQIRGELGPVRGLVHAAGVPGSGMLVTSNDERIARVLAPKVAGSKTLLSALSEDPMVFALFCSSTAALLGGVGLADYAAANAFLDAFAEQLRQQGVPALSIDWDTWSEIGMAAEATVGATLATQHAERLARGLSTAAGAAALWPALGAASVANVVVTRDDPLRSPGWSPRREEDGADPEPMGATRLRLDRRHLDSAFVAPESSLELAVTAAFEAVLGVDGIGLHDDFFALGGDSLSATQVVARLRERFAVDLPIGALLDGRTPEAVAAAIEGTLIEEAEQVDA